jgi:hypothetical protein
MPTIRKYYSSQQLGWLGRKVHCSQAIAPLLKFPLRKLGVARRRHRF